MATPAIRDIDKIPSQVVSTDKLDSGYLRQPADEFSVGKWLLFLDEVVTDGSGLTELDRAWAKIVPLLAQSMNRIIRIACSAGTHSAEPSTSGYRKKGYIACYTGDFKNVREVKQVALEVRFATNHYEVFYYKTEIDSQLKKSSSLGHFDVSLYKFNESNKLFTKKFGGRWFVTRDADRLEDINAERVRQIEEESKMLDSGTGSAPAEVELVPSRVTNKNYLDSGYMREPKNKLDAGRWTLSLRSVPDWPCVDGLTQLDLAWERIVRLTKRPSGQNLIRILCPTSASRHWLNRSSSDENPYVGVIECYTEDFNRVSEVRDAARAIRSATGYPGRMHYKMDVDPEYLECSSESYMEHRLCNVDDGTDDNPHCMDYYPDCYTELSCYMDDGKDGLFARGDYTDWVPVGTADTLESLAPERAEGIRKEMRESQAMKEEPSSDIV